MKAPILLAFEKGLRIIRSIDKPEQYGPMSSWIIRFRKMYCINSHWANTYIYVSTLENELIKRINELSDKKNRKL